MKITLKDGSVKEYAEAKSVIEIAADISEGLARAATAGEIDGEIVDLRTPVDKDCNLNILTFNDEKGKGAFRHTASHIMAQAIKRLYPETKLAIGPSVADGFYYDVDRDTPFTAEDLEKIEKEMKKIVKENLPLVRSEKPRNEAIEYFKEKDEPYKVELIEDLPEDAVISFYTQGEFTDLCAGPHLMSTKYVKAFKLTSLAGAYWRGNEKNKMLQRIYGTAFPKKAELEEYLHMLEEAKKRGLYNLVSTPDALPHFIDEKNERLLTSHHIFTDAELHSRYEIKMENYVKTLHIEANTLVEIIQKDLLPSITTYMEKLAQTASLKKSVVPGISVSAEASLLSRLTELAETMTKDLETLKADTAMAEYEVDKDLLKSAKLYQSVVLTDMEKVRVSADAAEALIPDSILPYPTYGKLLFSISD